MEEGPLSIINTYIGFFCPFNRPTTNASFKHNQSGFSYCSCGGGCYCCRCTCRSSGCWRCFRCGWIHFRWSSCWFYRSRYTVSCLWWICGCRKSVCSLSECGCNRSYWFSGDSCHWWWYWIDWDCSNSRGF